MMTRKTVRDENDNGAVPQNQIENNNLGRCQGEEKTRKEIGKPKRKDM